jgi:hypothetical protein
LPWLSDGQLMDDHMRSCLSLQTATIPRPELKGGPREGFAEIGNLAMGATTTARALVFAIATKFPALHPFTTTSIHTDGGAPRASLVACKESNQTLGS